MGQILRLFTGSLQNTKILPETDSVKGKIVPRKERAKSKIIPLKK